MQWKLSTLEFPSIFYTSFFPQPMWLEPSFLQSYTTQQSLSPPSKELKYWIKASPSNFSLGWCVIVHRSLRYLLELRLLLEGSLSSGDSAINTRLLIIIFRKTSHAMSLRNADVKIVYVNHISHATSVMLRETHTATNNDPDKRNSFRPIQRPPSLNTPSTRTRHNSTPWRFHASSEFSAFCCTLWGDTGVSPICIHNSW